MNLRERFSHKDHKKMATHITLWVVTRIKTRSVDVYGKKRIIKKNMKERTIARRKEKAGKEKSLIKNNNNNKNFEIICLVFLVI